MVISVCTSVIDGAVQIFERVHSLEDSGTPKHSHIPSNVDSDPPLALSVCVCVCALALIHDG